MTEKISLDVGMLKKDCTEALQKTFNGVSKNISKYFKFERNDKQSEAAKIGGE